MNVVKISKKKAGEFRTIYVPDVAERAILRRQMSDLNRKTKSFCGSNIHGFVRGRSPVTNAKAHVGYRFTLSFDLKDFFDSVKPEQLKGKLSQDQINICFVDGAPRQGLPTSPAVANIAAVEMDKAINKKIVALSLRVVYTRYADDLTFSFNEYENYSLLLKEIPAIVQRCGFKVNANKTRLQDSKFGLRNITGVNVGESSIKAPREIRRRLRAAIHNKSSNQARGLAEWNRLKEPSEKIVNKAQHETRVDDANTIAVALQRRIFKSKEVPEKEDIRVADNVIISGDPAYLFAPSNWNSAWTSCIAHPKPRSPKNRFWVLHPNIRIAVLQGEAVEYEGVERRKMLARAFVYDLDEGGLAFGRIYGENKEARTTLLKALIAFGAASCNEKKGALVKGIVKRSLGAGFLDNLCVDRKYEGIGKRFRIASHAQAEFSGP